MICNKCNKAYKEEDFSRYSDWLRCGCGGIAMKGEPSSPLINFNNWKPDYSQMDGEKEFIAAGGYE